MIINVIDDWLEMRLLACDIVEKNEFDETVNKDSETINLICVLVKFIRFIKLIELDLCYNISRCT